MAAPTYKYSGVCYTATADQTTFALTTSGGDSIGYLKQDHIQVRTSADSGNTWTRLTINTDYVFANPATSIVLNTGATAGTLVDISRHTPLDDDYIDFQAGSLLTAAELNLFDTWQLYIDQELADKVSTLDGSVTGEAVKSVTGTAPIQVDNTDNQKPVISIDETTSSGNSNQLTSDTKVMSEKAIDEAFKQYIGTSPTTGEKVGQIRIDNTGTTPMAYYWSGSAWIQLTLQGPQGEQGPVGPAPGLQDPAASAANVALNADGTLGTATAQVEQDPTTKDLKFLFGIPVGQKGEKGDTGDASTVPGPAPGLQSPAAEATNVPNQQDGTVGLATATVSQDANKDLKFTFGVPVGIRGEQGPPGEGVDYKGPIDATSDPAPTDPNNGDFYVNTQGGSSSWTGLSTVTQNDRLIYNGNTNQWDRYTPPPITGVDLGYTAATDKGTVTNAAGTNAVIPLVDDTNAGLMAPTEHSKLDGIAAGAQVNPDLSNYLQKEDNVSELKNDANYITLADVPSASTPTLQAVLDQGNTSTTDLWVGDGGQTVKLDSGGTVDASNAMRVGSGWGGSSSEGISMAGNAGMTILRRANISNPLFQAIRTDGTNTYEFRINNLCNASTNGTITSDGTGAGSTFVGARLNPTGDIEATRNIEATGEIRSGVNWNAGETDPTGVRLDNLGDISIIKRSGSVDLINAQGVFANLTHTFSVSYEAVVSTTNDINCGASIEARNLVNVGTNFGPGNANSTIGVTLNGGGNIASVRRDKNDDLMRLKTIVNSVEDVFKVDADAKVSAKGFRIDQLDELP